MLKKCTKRFLAMIIAFLFIITMTPNVFATNDLVLNTPGNTNTALNDTNSGSVIGNTTLEVVEDNVCNIPIGDLGSFEKKITDFDANEKSVTLTLSVTNLKDIEETQKDAEIFLVVDNSSSMTEDYVGEETRKQAVIDSANSLVDKLFESNPNTQIGVVGFSSKDSAKGETEGTIEDASLESTLSSSVDEVKTAISNLSNLEVGPRTNIEAGLTLAQDNFSSKENVNKYVLLLTDGVPNNDTNGTFGKYSGTVATRTKSKLEELENSDIKVIAAMINLNGEDVEPTTERTYAELAQEIFGTEENSTTSKYFYIPDSEIEDTIVNDIFNSLVTKVDNTLSNITITDYFPQEIIDNFNFEYVASPNIGTVSQSINTENNSITWNIELLSEGETATLSYKLTLKDDYDKNIIDQILKTNTKVDITADNNGETLTETSDVSPTIRVRYQNNIVDNTVAVKPIPQTGDSSSLWFIAIVMFLVLIVIGRIIYLKKYSNK